MKTGGFSAMQIFRPDDWDVDEGGRRHTAHVVPNRDLIVHDANLDGSCVCGPATIPVETAHGGFGWIYQHHSLDGRELSEGDHDAGA